MRPSSTSTSPATRAPSTTAASTPTLTRRSMAFVRSLGRGRAALSEQRLEVGDLVGSRDGDVDRCAEVGEIHRHRRLRILEPCAVVEAHALAPHPTVAVDPDIDGGAAVHALQKLPELLALWRGHLRGSGRVDDRAVVRRLDPVDRLGPDRLRVA